MEPISVAELATRVRASIRIDARPSPLFTFLLGSGFSLSAGLPSTNELVDVLRERLKQHGNPEYQSWSELLTLRRDGKLDLSADTTPAAMAYQQLLSNPQLFPFTTARQLFITEVVRWAASRQVEINRESLLLASILIAGAQHSHDATKDDRGRPSDLSRFIAHTAYTTNFDEVLPQTFRYFGEPVAVVDHVGAHGRAQGSARHPRVVYLHGSHLFYDLRNSENEIREADGDRTGGVDLSGLFQRFREILRTTGLIVLGYSGWPDRALSAIRDALADRESLPFNLYWGAYPSIDSLSHQARALLDEHPGRAFVLEPGKDAEKVLDDMVANFGVNHNENMNRWQSRTLLLEQLFEKMRAHPQIAPSADIVERLDLDQASDSLGWTVRAGALMAELRETIFNKGLTDISVAIDSVDELLNAATADLRNSHEFRGLMLLKAQLLMFKADPKTCVIACEKALQHYRTAHDEMGTLSALFSLGQALARDHKPAEAEEILLELVDTAQRLNFDLGVVYGSLALARVVAFFKFEREVAFRLAETAEHLARDLADDDLKASVIFFKADFESTFGQLDTADHRYGEALDYVQETQSERAMILLGAATNAIRAGQLPRAEQMLGDATTIAERLKFETIAASILAAKAVVCAATGNAESAARIFEAALAQLETIGSPHGYADALIDYSKFLLQRGRCGDAAKIVARAATIGSEIGSAHIASRAHVTEASIALRLGDLVKAEASLNSATTVEDEKARKSKALRLRAKLAVTRGVTDDAMRYLAEAHEVDLARHDHRGVAETLFRVSEIHLDLDQLDQASEAVARAREALSKVNDRRLLGYAMVIEGRILLKRKMFVAAREKHQQGRTHFEKFGDIYGTMIADLYITEDDSGIGAHDQARERLLKVKKLAEDGDELAMARQALQALERLDASSFGPS